MKNLLKTLYIKYGIPTILVLITTATILLLTKSFLKIPVLIPADYNEGWNAFHATRAFNRSLYPEPNALISNNYPPLSFYIVGSLGLLLGDDIIAGRIISSASLLIVGLNIALVVNWFSRAIITSLFSGLLFVAYMAAYHPGYVGMNDPQLLGHALMLTGLVVFLFLGQEKLPLLITMLLTVAGGLTKHNLITLPLAITIWLFVYKRRSFYIWIASSTIVLVSCFLVFYLIYGSNFFIAIFASAREYNLDIIPGKLTNWLTPSLILVAACITFITIPHRNHYTNLIVLYVLFSGVWGIFIMGGEGVDSNAIFDLIIGLTIISGLAVDEVSALVDQQTLTRSSVKTMSMLILLLPVLLVIPQTLKDVRDLPSNLKNQEALVAQDIAFIKAQPGRAMCEELALCYWAGKSFEVDFFMTGQKIRKGVISEDNLSRLIKSHYFSVVQFYPGIQRLPEQLNQEILGYYEDKKASKSGLMLLLPKSKSNLSQ
ncbi:hypothetical protein G7B40_023890 [Aetokthonos hydrillicola Thurmond2011]|jgi:hypothetical protein|uniref:Uncharacterized protein n=1 Tax=Aetokthonos hydrillicola Thurmond2011 TaxID=2712845 RepID=A0AAP5IER2_9CYAN|nr:hypothetical protein [Aetokthonos hydrillicola]MBO3460207.1 hypothetical protein [Aetokthonos hydrillicola CCALA 1050]MBW4586940.1 hypothetical protein [Aetokthonos hydrillicola CCALA 1050]MDR9897585.1 hypothetical protein [Aetokthonos hydrillicola Thurmond2011]